MEIASRLPVMQAPIGPATTTELVAAVSAAGGLGTLAASWTDPAKLRAQLQRLRATLAEPFCVNLVLAFDQDERLAVVLDERTPVVSFSWGVDEALIRQAQRAGTAVYVQVGDVATARAAEAAGADALIVQGVEAGGHVQATEPLLDLVREVRSLFAGPLIAAGGIGEPRTIAAARAAGADAVACGTVYLAAEEANVHPAYLERLISAGSAETVVTQVFDGGWPDAPHRVIRNETTSRWEAAGRPEHGARPGEGEIVSHRGETPVLRYNDAQPTRNTVGDIEAMAMYAGTSVAAVSRREPASAITRRLSQA